MVLTSTPLEIANTPPPAGTGKRAASARGIPQPLLPVLAHGGVPVPGGFMPIPDARVEEARRQAITISRSICEDGGLLRKLPVGGA